MKLTQKFPNFYHRLLPDVVSWEVPDERFADCSNCHLCASDKLSINATKCCTYHAILPNYMLGALLSDKDPAWQIGISKIEDKIKHKLGVTPYGIAGTPDIVEFNRERRNTNKLTTSFEEREKYTCPYLDNGRCSVWKYRGELCITYFCFPVSGRQGNMFWNNLWKYIRFIEKTFSIHALIECGYPIQKINFIDLEHDTYDFLNDKGELNIKMYSQIWNPFLEKEIELYKNCYDVIHSLDEVKVKEILGSEGRWRKEKCKKLLGYAKQNVIPDGLVFNSEVVVEKINQNIFKLITPNGEHLKVPMNVYMALKKFDGTVNVQDIARSSNLLLFIKPELVQRYINAGVLSV